MILGSETAMSPLPRNGATYNLALNNNSEITKFSAGEENTLKCTLPITTENSTISKELPNAIANALQSTTKVILLLTNSSTTQENCIQIDLSDQNQEVDMQALNPTRNLQDTLETRENNDDRLNNLNKNMVTTETTVKRNRGRPRKGRTHIEHQSSSFQIFHFITARVRSTREENIFGYFVCLHGGKGRWYQSLWTHVPSGDAGTQEDFLVT